MSDDTLGRIAEWCEAAADLAMDGTTVTVAGDPPVTVMLEESDDALVLNHTHAVGEAHEDFADKAKALLGGRGSMIEGDVATDKEGTRVEIRYPIYLDGLNRQTFLLAIRDITGAADGLGEIAGSLPQPEAQPEPDTTAAAAPAEEAAAEDEPAPGKTVVVDEAAAWVATHTVPGGGMSAWAEPDPGLAPVAKLSARVELQVNEQRGAWARVTGSNGWTGWVDARKLRDLQGAGEPRVPIGSAAPAAGATAAAPGAGGLTIRPLALLGGLMMILGSLPVLKWLPPLDPPVDAWDVPLGWLWQGSPTNPRFGLILVILGIAALALAVMPRVPGGALAAVAGIGLLFALVFVIHVIRLDWLAAGQIKVLWDGGVGIGWWITLIGAALVAIPYKLKL